MEKILSAQKDLEIIVLAAGKGKRMGGDKPKVLTEVNGRPMLTYVLDTVEKAFGSKPIIVVGFQSEKVRQVFGDIHRYAHQKELLGTADSVSSAIPHIGNEIKDVLILYGDQPLLNVDTLKALYQKHVNQNAPVSPLTLATSDVGEFTDWKKAFYDFGRIVRDGAGKIVKIVEKRDANENEMKITEVNPAYFCVDAKWLRENLPKISNNNAQGEYYLTDLVGLAQKEGHILNSHVISAKEILGVNTPEQLEIVERFMRE
jgi:UDP-N-acetylglucosamine diphosphorylase/glucosamine-1-phosphate N-acetyltransferase